MGWQDYLLRLGAACVIGAAIGLAREIHHKSAGFRTVSIVCLGVALATMMASSGVSDAAASSRVIQGALAGIGFLGSGVIFHHASSGAVEGLTTAASIWTAAVIGAACGLGFWLPALVTSGLVLLLLALGGSLEQFVRSKAS
jgi:putative Mg2+ transporter-C (MgtC) family protein